MVRRKFCMCVTTAYSAGSKKESLGVASGVSTTTTTPLIGGSCRMNDYSLFIAAIVLKFYYIKSFEISQIIQRERGEKSV